MKTFRKELWFSFLSLRNSVVIRKMNSSRFNTL